MISSSSIMIVNPSMSSRRLSGQESSVRIKIYPHNRSLFAMTFISDRLLISRDPL